MNRGSRLLLVAAAVALLVAIVLPLWEVRLVAPQYPEGLGLRIMSHTVRGLGTNDLHSINVLNHYIGMQAIVPESIPELRFMPWLIAAMGAWLLGIAGRGGRRQLLVWLVVLGVAGLVGLWDFWRWEYNYGHNLDLENAVIVVPGMSYQPPLIGRKQLLNFTAVTWPGAGAMLIGLAGLMVAMVWWRSGRRASTAARRAASALLIGTAACAGGVPKVALDLDVCHYCHMIISDDRHAAAAITSTGRTVRFDSVDCLAGWVLGQEQAPRSVWVTDIAKPGALIAVAEARFVRDAGSPMGRGWSAVAAQDAAEGALDWDALLVEVDTEQAAPPPMPAPH